MSTPTLESAHGPAHHHDGGGHVAHQFEDAEQQKDASNLGMWAFLATEVMFFGGLFGAFCIYRFTDPEAFGAASLQLDVLLGTVNTVVLLTSSLAMAMAVHAGQTGDRRGQVRFLLATLLLGVTFLGIKAREYYEEYEKGLVPGPHFNVSKIKLPEGSYEPRPRRGADQPPIPFNDDPKASGTGDLAPAPVSLDQRRAQLFFVFYFFMTGLHALHMIIGIAVVGVLTWMAWRGMFGPAYHTPLELTGLYWHFVDIVWVFLYPTLYLMHLHK